MRQPEYLFVYGTLLTGTGSRRLDRLVSHCCVAHKPAYVRARLYDLGDYPAAVPATHARERVYGQLCQLTDADACLRAFDHYELYFPGNQPNCEYLRRRTYAFIIPSHRRVSTWIYFYHAVPADKPRIHSGDYRRHIRGGKG